MDVCLEMDMDSGAVFVNIDNTEPWCRKRYRVSIEEIKVTIRWTWSGYRTFVGDSVPRYLLAGYYLGEANRAKVEGPVQDE